MTSQAAPAAHSSSFYTAMRVLPERRREAMLALYDFCRAVDDIADERGPATASQRLAELERWRAGVAEMFEGRPPPPFVSLDRAVRDFDLKQEDFKAVIDGMAMDAAEDIRAPDWATLDLYCDRVASAVGRLSVRIFGLAPEPGNALAHHLGRALQLTIAPSRMLPRVCDRARPRRAPPGSRGDRRHPRRRGPARRRAPAFRARVDLRLRSR